MIDITVNITDKIATADNTVYVCGNSDYVVCFEFDEEWDAFDVKTARFIPDDLRYVDVVFEGSRCPVPVLSDTRKVKVGVFAGDLHTTTPAIIYSKKSILCDSGTPAAPSADVYNQLMETIQGLIDRIEALEKGGVPEADVTSPVLGVAILDSLRLA